MTYTEDELLPLSALQHFLFCERQCALIHVEQVWEENRFTAEGRIMHEKADSGYTESRGDVRIERSVQLKSITLGLSGKADVVEFHKQELKNNSIIWRPFPVEYKRGKPKPDDWDRVQLCAQAVCLEEMLSMEVPEGALFYGRNKRREGVSFNRELRTLTENTAESLHRMFLSRHTPPPRKSSRCDSCSLSNLCMPLAMERKDSVDKYIRNEMGLE